MSFMSVVTLAHSYETIGLSSNPYPGSGRSAHPAPVILPFRLVDKWVSGKKLRKKSCGNTDVTLAVSRDSFPAAGSRTEITKIGAYAMRSCSVYIKLYRYHNQKRKLKKLSCSTGYSEESVAHNCFNGNETLRKRH